MPKSHSYKRTRDAATIAEWRRLDPAQFEALGLDRRHLEDVQIGLEGPVLVPGQADYDRERGLSNPVFDGAPAAIVCCRIENDVRIALQMALDRGLRFMVRSGGHCTAGFSTGPGVLIDVSGLRRIDVDPVNRLVRVGTGLNFGALNKELAAYGLHIPGGECEGVCVGGFVQGGGLGFTSATYGMNSDNVLEMRVMLADGSVVIASETRNADLWWAMRGGTGGNFGVLLSVTYRAYPLKECTGWALAWPMTTREDRAACVEVMNVLQDQYLVPDTYGRSLTLQVLFVWQNELKTGGTWYDPKIPVFTVRGLWVGDKQEGLEAMKPLSEMAGCVSQFDVTGPYMTVLDALLNEPQEQPVIDESKGMPNEDKSSRYVAQPIPRDGWQEIFDYFVTSSPNDLTYGYLEVYGGAIKTYLIEKSAFIHRNVLFNTVMDVFWYTPKQRADQEEFMRGWNDMIEKYWNTHVYQNYASVSVPDYIWNYWGNAAAGLWQVKEKYDPKERFSFAQQVRAPEYSDRASQNRETPAFVSAALKEPIDHAQGLAAYPGPAAE